MAWRRTSHAVYDASYHLVWCPKYRKKLFEDGLIRERAAEMLREISEEYGFEIDKLEVAVDHVHVLLSFPPKYSISEVVRTLKSKSGRALFREFPRIKRKLWGGELWGDGYL
ncbi:MAG: IS200/IS605 family transposase [Proteobacteria bacterium]|jgi:putative transposase|nr:IS200/IS605 family transposase [Pseudomonadota bacterium]